MKDVEANVRLIRHVTQRIDEFLDEHRSEEFETAQDMQHVFSLWLQRRDSLEAPPEKN